MKGPPPSTAPQRGDQLLREDGFSYLPRFLANDEADELARFFAGLMPLWEQRYSEARRRHGTQGRISRPVYWLGAWQFAALGYYAEPDHTQGRCLRGEPFPQVMQDILARLQPELEMHGAPGPPPNTCLINYYGSERKGPHGPNIDCARLNMHRDQEPGAVVMLSIGQPAQFEFLGDDSTAPQHSQWVRHRSVTVISGEDYKERLYHRITRVRHGQEPALETQLENFQLRRVSVSFRHVPEGSIQELWELPPAAQDIARPYVEQLAEHSGHYRAQLAAAKARD